MPRLSRRRFVQSSVLAGAAFAAGGVMSTGVVSRAAQAKAPGPNDTVRVGVAGCNGRGGAHIGDFLGQKGVEITYLIDPDQKVFAKHLDKIKGVYGREPQQVADVRKALEDKQLDAISIATPNHWHSLMTIWACQAGKDVYVEKPMSHNVHEGRIAAEMAKKHGRIVQHGTQSRSDGSWANVAEVIRSGKYGKLLVSRALCYKPRGSIGMKSDAPPPANLDFNLWLGPAAERPYHGNLVHYNWHWFWDFGNGDIGNQGVHQMDIARWMIPGATLPTKVTSLGGRFGYSDQGETPNTQLAVMEFGGTQLIFEVRGLKTDKYLGENVGNICHLEAGTIVGNKTFIPKGSDKPEGIAKLDAKRGPGGGNFSNFIAAVRSRNEADLNAPVLEGHYSSACCHLANISYRLGQSAPFNPVTKAFGDNKDAYETLERMGQHLTTNGIKLEETQYTLGRTLTFVPEKEQFVGDGEANALLTRKYREGFVVPATV